MTTALHRLSTAVGVALGAASVIASMGGCGGPRGSLEQLSVTQYRYNVDESGNIVRVLGVVRNSAEERTPTADIVVTLVGRTGAEKGQNRTELPSLDGGAEHRFALGVTAHGRVEDVQISIVPRGALLEGETEGDTGGDAPANADAPDNAGGQSDASEREGD